MQFIEDKLIIFRKRLEKLARDMKALGEYKTLIEGMQKQATIYDPKVFEHISPFYPPLKVKYRLGISFLFVLHHNYSIA